jgi:hypothetical protein
MLESTTSSSSKFNQPPFAPPNSSYLTLIDVIRSHEAAVTTVEKSELETGEQIVVKNRTQAALLKRQHDLLHINYMGTVQSVAVDLETDTLSATCDVRKGGAPDGY